jgi:hypothetical protein
VAEIPKFVTPSLATKLPCDAHRTHNLFPGEDLAAGDACYISATGVRRSTGAGALGTPAAKVDGFVMMDYKVAGNQPVTLYHGVDMAYGAATLVPGTRLFVSGTVVGGLADAASTSGTGAIATVQYIATLEGTPHAVLFVTKSTY